MNFLGQGFQNSEPYK